MNTLTSEQLNFLRQQKIPLSTVFDASGMRTADYQQVMKTEGKSFAYGVTQCSKGGHALRTRKGHCIQCDHATIAFMLRNDKKAFVYIAASYGGRLIKVGSSEDVVRRERQLCDYRYGGQDDWQMVSTARSEIAGRAECETQAKLSLYAVPGEYVRAGRAQQCYELFRCNFADAKEALASSLGTNGQLVTPHEVRALHTFNFR